MTNTRPQLDNSKSPSLTEIVSNAISASPTFTEPREIAFVDTSVDDYQSLVDGLPIDMEVVLIDGNQDGIQQIASWAQTHTGYDAIHILSHGSTGDIHLGTTHLTSDTLAQHTIELTAIGNSLTADGDILVYGCSVANGEVGKDFIGKLAQATSADIAASDDLTGNSALGGDWVLEKSSGEITSNTMQVNEFNQLLVVADENFTAIPLVWWGTSKDYNGLTYSQNISGNSMLVATRFDFYYGDSPTSTDGSEGTNINRFYASIDGVSTAGSNADGFLLFNSDPNNGAITPYEFEQNNVTSPVLKGAVDFRIKSTDGSEFYLASMKADVGNHVDYAVTPAVTSLTVKGYKDGVEVASDVIDFTASDSSGSVTYTKTNLLTGYYNLPGYGGVLTFNSSWGNIDEIRFTGSDASHYGMLIVDNLDFSSPVAADSTPPTASVTTATLANTANAVVQSTEAGTAYIVKDTVTVTNLASITGAADNNFNSVAISSANTNTNLALTGLVDGTYKVYTVDAAGNLSSASTNSIVIDSTAPTESDSTSSSLAQTTATISSTSDEAGTMYYVVTTSETPPSVEEVINHTASNLVTNAYGNSAVTAATQKDFSVTGLTASTQYYAYFVTVDAAGNQSTVASASFTTAIDPPPIIISTAVTTINEGAVYTYTLGASDNGDVSWSVKDGTSLPSWLTLGKGEAAVTIVDDFTDPGGMAYNEATGDIYATYSSLFSAFVEDAIPQTKIYKLAEDGTQTLFTNTEFGQVGSMMIYGDYLYAGYLGIYGTTNILVRYDLRDADGDVTPEVLLQNADGEGTAYYSSDVIAGLVEKDGYLYAVDYTNSDILKFDLANISASPEVYLDFNPDLSTENSGPYGIAFDAQGNLYGTLMDSGTVFKYDGEDLSVVMRIDGDVDGDGAQVLHGQPTDIKIDAEGNFYISHFGGTGGTSGIYKYNSSFVEQAPISTTANTLSMIFNNDGKIIAGDVQVDTQDPENPTVSGEIFGIDTVNYSLTGTAPLVNADTPTQITLVATDEAGNETEHSFTLTVHDLGAPTGTVTITGTATQGQMLTASNTLADADGLGTISYQWLADGQAITGATESTYTLSQAEVGKTMTVKASYTDGQGTAESVTSSATSAVANVNDAPTGTVSISGTATQGQMLTASNTLADADGLGTMSYQWLADGQAITGATESTYTLSQAEVGKAMTVKASYTDGQGTAESVTSSATSAVADTNDSPTFSATGANPTFTELLDLEFETLQNTNLTYLFTNSNFDTIEAGQEIIQATITVTNVVDQLDGESAEYLSIGGSFVQSIQIALQDGNTGSSSSPDLTYSVSVDKYKTATVVINSADTPMVWEQYASLLAYFNVSQNPTAGERVVTVTGLKDNGGTEDGGQDTTSDLTVSSTVNVVSVNDAPTGKVTISGTATQGQTLTASNSLADADGLGTMSYQWLADGQAITGATESTYTLSQAEVGKTMTVKASYTDGQGTAESVTSSATSAVAATPAPTQPPVTEAPTPAPTEPPVTEAPTPAPVTSTVDGTMVQTGTTTQTRTTTDATGQTVTTTVQVEQVIVTPVTDTRIEDTTTPSSQTADIPLFWGESTRTEWATTASLPVGVGITTEGTRSPDINQDIVTTLTQLIEETAPETDGGKTNMLKGGYDFLATLAQQSTETLVINKVTLTTANDATQPASVPIVISGTANNVTTPSGNSAPPVEALVIDTRQLPAGSILDLQNIEFAVIVGDNVTIRGGEGANILFAGTGGQNIRLGADDDELHAGDGDDWVGSQGGNDQIFGEEGNDVLYGGTGNDTLDGGTGSDIALFQYAISQYAINQNTDGSWIISHATEGTDTLKEIEFAEFADQTISLSGSNQWLNIMFQQNISLF